MKKRQNRKCVTSSVLLGVARVEDTDGSSGDGLCVVASTFTTTRSSYVVDLFIILARNLRSLRLRASVFPLTVRNSCKVAGRDD